MRSIATKHQSRCIGTNTAACTQRYVRHFAAASMFVVPKPLSVDQPSRSVACIGPSLSSLAPIIPARFTQPGQD